MNSLTRNLLFICLFLTASACGRDEEGVPKLLRPVLYEEVGFQGGEQVRTFSGAAKTDKVVNLSFRASGILIQLNMRVGQAVKKGELLGQLDNVQARLAYEQAVSALNSAASQLNTAKLGYERVRSLYEKGSSSLSDFESAKNSFRTAEANHESAQRSVEIQQEQIRYGSIYAPEAGTIAVVNVEPDENVSAGQVVAVLNVGTDMEISLGLPESVINRVQPEMDVQVSFSSIVGEVFKARVTEISPSVDANASTYPVRVRILDPGTNIRSGMTASVTFDFRGPDALQNSLVVPAKAVGEDGKGRFVFLIEETGNTAIVKKQPVKLGNLTTDGFEIVSGLVAGQKVATAGLQTLLDGQEVRLQ